MTALVARRKWMLLATVASAGLAADLLTKWLAHALLPDNGEPVSVIAGYWDFVLAFNEGAAFSMLENVAAGRVLLSVIGIIAIGAVIYMAKDANRRRAIWPLGLILGGAIGNLVERILFGRVTDFVFWHYQQHAWPVFNVADVILVVGVAVLFLNVIADRRSQRIEAETDS